MNNTPVKIGSTVRYHPILNGPDDGLVYTVTEIIECVLGGVHSQSAILKSGDRKVSCDVAHLTPAPESGEYSIAEMCEAFGRLMVAQDVTYRIDPDEWQTLQAAHATLRRTEALVAENQRLRIALLAYAQKANWCATTVTTQWAFKNDVPWKLAADALAQESEGR